MTPGSLTPKAEVTPPGGNDSRTTVPNVDDAGATKQTGSDQVSFSEYGRLSERAEALLNAKARPFPSLCLSFLCAYCSKKLPKGAPTKQQLRVLSIIDQLRAWAQRRSAYVQLNPLYPFLYPYVTHMINYSRPSPAHMEKVEDIHYN